MKDRAQRRENVTANCNLILLLLSFLMLPLTFSPAHAATIQIGAEARAQNIGESVGQDYDLTTNLPVSDISRTWNYETQQASTQGYVRASLVNGNVFFHGEAYNSANYGIINGYWSDSYAENYASVGIVDTLFFSGTPGAVGKLSVTLKLEGTAYKTPSVLDNLGLGDINHAQLGIWAGVNTPYNHSGNPNVAAYVGISGRPNEATYTWNIHAGDSFSFLAELLLYSHLTGKSNYHENSMGSIDVGNTGFMTFALSPEFSFISDSALTYVSTDDGSSPTATPEPGTMLLMGIGAAGVAFMKRRRNAKASAKETVH